MKKNRYQGKFIVFEGLDGSGHSTQAELLKNFLIKKGYKVVLTKEPTLISAAGKKIYFILNKKEKTTAQKLQDLFVKDRKEHLKKVIIPALKKGKIVISDRYFFSTIAYGSAEGLSFENLVKKNNNFLMPDLTFILKVRPKICINRIEKRKTKKTIFEKEEKLKKVWQYYKIFPKKFENIKIIEGEKPINEVFLKIKKSIKNFFQIR